MTTWTRRPTPKAARLNPALGAVVLHAAATGFASRRGTGLDWPLAFLVYPLVVHEPTRAALPRDTRTHLPVWVQRHPLLRSQTAERAAGLTDEVREGLRHGLRAGVLRLDGGRIIPASAPGKATGELADVVKSAALVGRWFARYSASTAFALFGVRP